MVNPPQKVPSSVSLGSHLNLWLIINEDHVAIYPAIIAHFEDCCLLEKQISQWVISLLDQHFMPWPVDVRITAE